MPIQAKALRCDFSGIFRVIFLWRRLWMSPWPIAFIATPKPQHNVSASCSARGKFLMGRSVMVPKVGLICCLDALSFEKFTEGSCPNTSPAAGSKTNSQERRCCACSAIWLSRQGARRAAPSGRRDLQAQLLAGSWVVFLGDVMISTPGGSSAGKCAFNPITPSGRQKNRDAWLSA